MKSVSDHVRAKKFGEGGGGSKAPFGRAPGHVPSLPCPKSGRVRDTELVHDHMRVER